jgi:hypothetical protein
MAAFILARHPHCLQEILGQKMCQLAAILPVGLDVIPAILRDQTRRCHNALGAVVLQMIVKPETEVPCFI